MNRSRPLNLKFNPAPLATMRRAAGRDGRYQPISFWQETIDVVPGEPLSADLQCDVAIVGGGFTGLSVACELKRAANDLHVVLIERDVIGHGASGRNGGFAMPLIGWDLTHAVRTLGQQAAQRAYRLMYDAVDHLKRTVDEEQIDCDLEATGYLLLATCAAREKRLRHEAELGEQLGFGYRWLEGDALSEHIRSQAFRGGVFDPRPLIINPAKLARGLKRVAESLGVEIYEQTSLTELRDEAPLLLRTEHATLRANTAVLALNGYGAAMGFMPNRIMPVHTYIVLTEPLTDEQLDEIGWSAHRTSLETARNFIHYFRLTADNRILFGGEDAQLYRHEACHDADRSIFARLEARFRQYFPSLDRVAISHRWGGVLGVTLDMFPTFGCGGQHGNVFHATAYCGHGVALSNYAGRLLAPHVLRQLGRADEAGSNDLPFFYDRQPPWLPPDPLRWIGLQAYRKSLQWLDRWQGA